MAVTAIQSVNVFAKSLDATVRFYDDVLSLPIVRRTDAMVTFYDGRKGAQFNVLRATGEDANNVGRSTGVSLRVREYGDLESFVRRLQAKAGGGDVTPFPGGNRLESRDPDDNRVYLAEHRDEPDSPAIFDGPASVTVRVRNLRSALEFYVGLLELPMADQPDPGVVVLFSGQTQLLLTDRPGRTPAVPVDGETGICLAMDDAERTFDDLAGRGARFAVAPRLLGPAWLASLRDPDGNVFTLYGPAA